MPTIQEILAQDTWGEKTASESTEQVTADQNTLEKVAMEFDMYKELFPEDSDLSVNSNEKVAEEEKVAQEEALGARAYEYSSARFDNRMSKIAEELMAAAANMPGARPPQAVAHDQSAADAAPRDPAAATGYSVAAGQEAGAEGQVGMEAQAVEGDSDVHDQEAKLAMAIRRNLLRG